MEDAKILFKAFDTRDSLGASKLLPLVYDELRKLAAAQLANEPSGQTLQPTALVHEAYMRLVGGTKKSDWDGCDHFFAAAAIAIRRVLVENARRKRSQKRGKNFARLNFDFISPCLPEPQEDLLALDEALGKLEIVDPLAAQLVNLRYFAGMTIREAAQTMGVSIRTAGRIWAFARAWLRRDVEMNASRLSNGF